MMHAVDCIVEHKSLKLNQRFTYVAPIQVDRGMRVEVEFNRQFCVALVLATHALDDPKMIDLQKQTTLKPIHRILDEEPLLKEELMALGEWLAQETLAPLISCYQVMLPKAKQIASSATKAKMEWMCRFIGSASQFTQKQDIIIQALKQEDLSYTYIKKAFGSAIDTLIKQGHVERYQSEKLYRPVVKTQKQRSYALSPDQEMAIEAIETAKQSIVCLYGPTGSGKTEIYLHLAELARIQHRQVLIMVPEIALTHQMVERVESRFGEDVIVYHSHLSNQERYLQYQRVLHKESHIVIGTRSSIFLPFDDLAWIVLDEEHDHSYKQESLPYYHARDVAIHRVQQFQAKIILGSATPSFETYARALKGNYALVNLPKRIKGKLPNMHLIQTKASDNILHPRVLDALKHRLSIHEQSIILINRRGYAPILQCINCGESIQCDACDRAMVVHKAEGVMKCHSCGRIEAIPQHCPSCRSSYLRQLGYGSQKLQEQLKEELPQARILRMDRDTTRAKSAHQNILGAFERHEADILVGTQMIAKGLDIEKVSLSVIVDIDRSLLRSDYRSVEDAFSLIVQTAGRSGRSEVKSDVYIQTSQAQHYALKYALSHHYTAFFKEEMARRYMAQNPPYSYLMSILLYHRDHEQGLNRAYALMQALAHETIKLLGPSDLGKTKNTHRIRVILKGKDKEAMRQHIQTILNETIDIHHWDLVVDTHPLSLL